MTGQSYAMKISYLMDNTNVLKIPTDTIILE